MNNLSILIYLAEILGNIGDTLFVFGILFGIIGAVSQLVVTVERAIGHVDADNHNRVSRAWAPNRVLGIIGAVMVCISLFLPTQETVYAIAVSEMGEAVVESDIGSKALQGLENWLDEQLQPTEETVDEQ